MGKKTRIKEKKLAEMLEVHNSTLRDYTAPKKVNKRKIIAALPSECNKYPFIRPLHEFKSSSYSYNTRLIQLIKFLFCKYQVPLWIINWFIINSSNNWDCLAGNKTSELLMKLIYTIGRGFSPREMLKPYLSKPELKIFFKEGKPSDFNTHIFGRFMWCKAKAKGLDFSICTKFENIGYGIGNGYTLYTVEFMNAFIDFCSRCNANPYAIQDIWDYLVSNHFLDRTNSFSFKGRTLASVLNLVNKWHEELNREERARAVQDVIIRKLNKQEQKSLREIEYKKVPNIQHYFHCDKNEKHTVEVIQITKYDDLVNEGRAMHNCVASYHRYCVEGLSSIFSLRIDDYREATIEVKGGQRVVQARAYCNAPVEGYALKALEKWMRTFKLANCI